MKTFLSAITLLISFYGLTQTKDDLNKVTSINGEYLEKIHSISTPLSLTKKSFYLDEDWNHMVIITRDDEILHANGRINLVRMLVEILVEKHIRRLNESRVRALIFDGDKIMRIPASRIEDRRISSYMQVLSDGQVTLLEAFKIGFKTESDGYSGVVVDEKMILESDFYYTTDFSSFNKLKGKKEILSIMEDQKSAAEVFIKDNKLKLDQKRDLAVLFDFYNDFFDSNKNSDP